MMPDMSDALAQRIALGVPAALLAGAYISQYGFGLFPCEMCMWQRWPHFAALGLALIGGFLPPRKLWIALAAGAIATSGVIGAFHAGVEYGWWEGITGCATAMGSGGGSALDSILAAPIVRCDTAPWTLFGISLAGWNALFSVGSAITIWSLLIAKENA